MGKAGRPSATGGRTMSDKYLAGKVAWVTGGASGMGWATALALAQAGGGVAGGSLVGSRRGGVLNDKICFPPADGALDSAKAEIESQGVRALAMALDVCSQDSVTAGYRSVIDAFGKI